MHTNFSTAFQEADPNAARRYAHSLKSGARSIGAKAVAQAAEKLELLELFDFDAALEHIEKLTADMTS